MTTDPLSGLADAPGRILVVDDLEPNRLLVRDLLELQGHEVAETADGASALLYALENPVETIVLDVQMPVMDGLELTRRLRAVPKTAAIPIILVTALGSREDRLAGIRAGANDFLTKPIDSADLTLRVRNALRTWRLYSETHTQLEKLRELERLRDNLVHMVVHDLRSPLTGILGILDLMQLDIHKFDRENASALTDALGLTRTITDMVSDLLDVSRMEAGELQLRLEKADAGKLCADAIRTVAATSITVDLEQPLAPVELRCDKKLITRVVTNLVDNAVKFSPAKGFVNVSVGARQGACHIKVHDDGPGIPVESRERVFEKFGQVDLVDSRRRSSGLGLTFCKLAVEAHGGLIGIESEGRNGSTFWVSLPISV
jgi:signal transduction histidine kinase